MKRIALSAIALTTGLASLAAPQRAEACGGFFCSSTPVDQSGEQIIFGMRGDTITAQILINYTGPAESFSWLLPVASTPEISLGTLTAFQQLGWRTQPQFNVQWTGDMGQCGGFWMYPSVDDFDAGNGDPNEGGVNVLSRKDVGPFETVTLEANTTAELVKWLDDNGYDQPPAAIPLLDHYVKQDMKFVALRLQKDEPSGAIQPITLTFREADPCVPLVLTQIAATPDMPVQLYLFSDHRVVPTNWFHVTVNERRIDWIQNGQNYGQLLTAAVDEAAGHGFVTEYAGTSDITEQIIWRDGQYDTSALANQHDRAAFVMGLLEQGFPRDASMQALLRQFIPMPQSLIDQGVGEQQFYNDLSSYEDALKDQPFDPAAFVAALEERVIKPLRDTQALFDAHPKLTRLYTTVSADEMNRDPVFAENADLPDVSNVRTAQGVIECDGSDVQKIRVTLPDGSVIDYEPTDTWPYAKLPPELANEPAAVKIELIGRSGPPVLVDPEKVQDIDSVLNSMAPDQVLLDVAKDPFDGHDLPHQVPSSSASGGCSGGGNMAWGALAALGLLFFLRRSRV